MSGRGNTTTLTPDEAISTINRSQLPTVITEGVDDYLAFRRIEDSLHHLGISVMPVGGRKSVLEIYERRNEIKDDKKVIFFADRDLWVMGGVPREYIDERLLFTDGYSIENDLYRDGELESILTNIERANFLIDLASFAKWYAFAVDRIANGSTATIDDSPSRVLSSGKICPNFSREVGYQEPPSELYETIYANYAKFVRGKSLISLLAKHLSSSDRPAKFSKRALLDLAASKMGPFLKASSDKIEAAFG